MKDHIFTFLYIYDNLFTLSELFTIDNSLFKISLIGRFVVVLTTISMVVERVVSSAYIIKSKVWMHELCHSCK